METTTKQAQMFDTSYSKSSSQRICGAWRRVVASDWIFSGHQKYHSPFWDHLDNWTEAQGVQSVMWQRFLFATLFLNGCSLLCSVDTWHMVGFSNIGNFDNFGLWILCTAGCLMILQRIWWFLIFWSSFLNAKDVGLIWYIYCLLTIFVTHLGWVCDSDLTKTIQMARHVEKPR